MNKLFGVVALVVVITSFISYSIGYSKGRLSVETESSALGTTDEVAPNTQSTGSTLPPDVPVPTEYTNVFGTVEGIDGNNGFTLSTGAMPLSEGASKLRKVLVNESTIIKKNEPKDHEEFQKEFEAYEKLRKSASSGEMYTVTPPLPFTEVVLKLSEIVVGDSVSVTAGENIATKSEFVAKEINIMVIPKFSPTTAVPSQPASDATAPAPTTN